MKSTNLQTSTILLSLLLSLSFPMQSSAVEHNAKLVPDDVPLVCIDICGPMVELSTICQIPVGSKSEKRRLKIRQLHCREPMPYKDSQTPTADSGTAHATEPPQVPLPKASLTHRSRFTNTTQPAETKPDSTKRHTTPIEYGTVIKSRPARNSTITPSRQPTATTSASSTMGIWRQTSAKSATLVPTGIRPSVPQNTSDRSTNGSLSFSFTGSFRTGIPATGNLRPSIPLFTNGGNRTLPTTTTSASETPSPSPLPSSSTPDAGLPTIIDSGDPLAVGNAAGTENIHSGVLSTTELSTPAATSTVKDSQLSGIDIKRVQAAEEDCVCSNDSFNVARIAALCSSCITQAGFPMGPATYIVWTCNFTEQVWTSRQDSLANNVVVKAKTPRVTGVNGSPRSSVNGRLLVLAGAFGTVSLLL
ncbi:hypothetical protein BROUX41_004043 [Berkeleyomyces rouxiae]|uniref:uncharacterized protein n=1 Tax=Berkeleyomyces rouxiae TaxID=2035830 RepID=UPI003B827967